MTVLTVDLVRDDAGLPPLAPEWLALWTRASASTVFQSPLWLLHWWRHFGTGRPRVATLRGAGGELLGVLPMYVLRRMNRTQLLPFGAAISDYFDALLAPDAPADAADLLLGAVLDATADDELDVCELLQLPPGARLLAAVPPGRWRQASVAHVTCPVLTIGGDFAFSVPALQRRKLRMARHRADRMGGWQIAIATPQTVDQSLADLIGLHQACWTMRGHPGGVLGDPDVVAFHAGLVRPLVQADQLQLWMLRVGERIAAGCYVLTGRGQNRMLYLSGYDPQLGYVSPGTLLLGCIIEAAVTEGLREVHFLRGDEGYKYAWGAQDRMNTSRTLRRVQT